MGAFENLEERLGEIHDLRMAGGLLAWDQRTVMPREGGPARARQLATLTKLAHELLTAPETGGWLAEAEQAARDTESDEAGLLRVARREYDKATRIPVALAAEIALAGSQGEEAWIKAKEENDYAAFAPHLERLLGLKREYARAVGFEKKMYDALLDDYEEGMTCAELDPLFERLKEKAIGLVARTRGEKIQAEFLKSGFDKATQERFCRELLEKCGFDFNRGRLDETAHPFESSSSNRDVRIAVRYGSDPHAIFSCLHEMGHALYEMNVQFEGTPLAGGVSLGLHESQSRLWENCVGRSAGFWRHFYPRLQAAFPGALKGVGRADFHRAINRVEPTLIRTEADEVTYNLHIMLRYEMENELLEGNLAVKDAPAAWNEKMKHYLGVAPDTDREGILQDIHWSGGDFGYFPTYTLGNILSVQFFEKAKEECPGLGEQIGQGDFEALRGWMKEKIHKHGRKYTPKELIRKAVGGPMRVEPYLAHLERKVEEAYG